MNCEAVGKCMNAETSDFLFNRRDLKILSEDHVGHIPWCISCSDLVTCERFPWKVPTLP
jgi:hypothetical protein